VKKRRDDPMAGIRSRSPAKTVKPSPAVAGQAAHVNGQVVAPPPAAGKVQVYYDPNTHAYFAHNADGEYQRWDKDTLKMELMDKGYSSTLKYESGLSFVNKELLRITKEHSVHYAGPLGGYQPGIYEMFASRVLVTRGPKFLQPVNGEWPTLKGFLQVLLGDQCKFFFGWLKTALVSLRKGPPWSPGQLLAIAGPPGCGKSVLQSLITPLLGGRVSSPYAYLSGATNFNAEIYGAEHGLIGDVNHAVDPKARRNFGASIKKLVAEPSHRLEGKGRTAITLSPFLRITLTLNDEPAALHVLPSFDSDVSGKVMLLRGKTDGKRIVDAKSGDWQTFYNKMLKELPHFIWKLLRWQIPDSIADQRYTVVSFHDSELIEKVNQMSEEDKLLDLIDTYLLHGDFPPCWEGTATELERALGEKMASAGGCRLFRYSSHCGQLLEILHRKYEDRITRRTIGKNKKSYLVVKE